MNSTKKTILITGVAGFVGSNLADRLVREGHTVVGIDDLSAGILEQVPGEVDFHQVDIRSPKLGSYLKGVDAVFHLAAKNCVSECQLYPYETADVNILGTLNVFECARHAGVKRIIYAESSAIYEGTRTLPTPESDFTPQTFYAISKAADHLFARAYQTFLGMKMVGLRYLNVYGPRQDYRRAVPPVMSAFIIRLLTGQKPLIFGDGTKRRDFIHVDDVNDFHVLCLHSEDVVNRVFNLGSGRNYSILEIYNLICDILGSDVRPQFLPDVPGEAPANLGDIAQARSAGWEPGIDLKDGLAGMVEYIRTEIQKGNISAPASAAGVLAATVTGD
ncbi:MAG TPA: NAD-dependent epimerase/dehydratase family protein [Terracidiphilus sp.]|nr:NAD-dependent epimerase/dehydratase family protein [Terracidiphilus sp.]